MPSEPSGSSMATGRLRTPSVERMATCGWLMTGTVMKVPNGPALVMVKVPPEMSSMVSRLARALAARPGDLPGQGPQAACHRPGG